MNALALYGRYVMASIRMQLAYPASFAMLTIGSFLVTVVEFIGVWALFRRFGQVGGWRLGEVALFYGLVSVIFAFADAIARGFDVFLKCYERGLLIRTTADIIALSPPLVIEKRQIDDLFGMLGDVLKDAA